jgi:hypothetical protein
MIKIVCNRILSFLRFSIFAVLLVSLLSCGHEKKEPEHSDEIVLKIGDFEITKYEYEKNKIRFEQANPNYDKKELNTWLNSYIDETYMLAQAYKKRYDTISSINKTVNYEFNDKLSEVGGYVWNIVELPKLKVTKEELKNAYEKQRDAYFFNGLYFRNEDDLRKYFKNDVIKNELEFNVLIDKCKSDKDIVYIEQSLLWPFNPLAIYYNKIELMKGGDVIGPLQVYSGYYILHLIKKEELKQIAFNKEKEKLELDIKRLKSDKIIVDKQKEIFYKTKININEEIVEKFSDYLKKTNLNQVDKDLFSQILVTFQLNGKLNQFTIHDYIDYINNKFFTPENYSDKEKIKECLRSQVITRYLLCVADTLGILKDKWALLDQRNFKNNLIKSYFLNQEVTKLVSVENKEIAEFYSKRKESFAGNKNFTVSFLNFKTIGDANNNSGIISQILSEGKLFEIKDTLVVKNLLSYKPNQKVDFPCIDYPADIFDYISSMPLYQLSEPIQYKGNYILFFVTKKEGARVKELSEVKQQIANEIKNDKFNRLKDKLLKELKEKYSIVINKIN